MGFDDLLIAVIIAGIGLSGAYFRAEYTSWRSRNAADRRKDLSLCELHTHRLCRDKNGGPALSMMGAEQSVDAKTTASRAINDGSSFHPFRCELNNMRTSR